VADFTKHKERWCGQNSLTAQHHKEGLE